MLDWKKGENLPYTVSIGSRHNVDGTFDIYKDYLLLTLLTLAALPETDSRYSVTTVLVVSVTRLTTSRRREDVWMFLEVCIEGFSES